jgi:hypothetical protein
MSMTKGERAIEAIESHFAEVYSFEATGPHRPNFIWDIEMYQAIGLLPDDYDIPKEDELAGTMYALAKSVDEALNPDFEKDGYLLQSACVCYGGDSFPSKMKEALKVAFSITKARVKGLTKNTNKFKQLTIAFGKYVSGCRPGTEGWSQLDDEALGWAMATMEDEDG